MSEEIQEVAKNKNKPEEAPFILTPGQSISGITDNQTKAYQYLYGYDT